MRKRCHSLHPDDPDYEQKLRSYQAQRRGKTITTGILLLGAGAFVLLHRLKVVPEFRVLWPYFAIVAGLLIGLRIRFRGVAWLLLILVGTARIIPPFRVYGDLYFRDLVLPLALLGAGVAFLIRSQKKTPPEFRPASGPLNASPLLDINTVFGGRKEIVTAKDFAGGTVSTLFGGTELNLMQADAPQGTTVVLMLHVLFGGVELLVPGHWTVQNTIGPVFGGIDDRRVIRSNEAAEMTGPTLILQGSCVFGGIDIKSY